MSSTIHLHRVLRATPERVYRAFLDSEAMVKWVPPNGFTGNLTVGSWISDQDPRVGKKNIPGNKEARGELQTTRAADR